MSETNGVNGSEKVLCPRSDPGNWHSESVPNVHYASPYELAAHGGICGDCHAAIKRRHTKMRRGKTEHPADFGVLHHVPRPEDHTCWDSHTIGQFEDFDYDGMDEMHEEIEAQPADVSARAAELVSKIFVWCWSKPNPRTALVKFSALSAGLRDDLVGRDYPTLGKTLGVTKQAVSKAATLFQEAFGFRFSRSRSLEAREHMAASQRGHPGARKPKRTPRPGKESFSPTRPQPSDRAAEVCRV